VVSKNDRGNRSMPSFKADVIFCMRR